MLDLKQASLSIRKAAALRGIWSGKFEPVFDVNYGYDDVIARVSNRNHPDGIEILQGEAENALNYSWEDIKHK
jgi:hypothetical protein